MNIIFNCIGMNYFLVEARLKVVGGWRRARKMEGVRSVLKVSELNDGEKAWVYQQSLHGKYDRLRGEMWKRSWESKYIL